MKIFTLDTELEVNRSCEDVFAFFSRPENLDKITPPWLGFRIVTPTPIIMKPGTRIEYRIRLHAIPIRWVSEITAWEPPHRFVDRQVSGPYREWIHEHTFAPRNGGAQVGDYVRYAVLGGRVVNRLFVRRDVERIFAYRRMVLKSLFHQRPSTGGPLPTV